MQGNITNLPKIILSEQADRRKQRISSSLLRQRVAVESNPAPRESNIASDLLGPMNEIPTGHPSADPIGTVRCGYLLAAGRVAHEPSN